MTTLHLQDPAEGRGETTQGRWCEDMATSVNRRLRLALRELKNCFAPGTGRENSRDPVGINRRKRVVGLIASKT